MYDLFLFLIAVSGFGALAVAVRLLQVHVPLWRAGLCTMCHVHACDRGPGYTRSFVGDVVACGRCDGAGHRLAPRPVQWLLERTANPITI